MSNKTQLQTNNTTLDSLISRVNSAKNTVASLPEAGGSEVGTDIATCTVTITADPGTVSYVTTRFIEGQIVSYVGGPSFGGDSIKTVTIDNVVRGSAIFVTPSFGYVMPAYSVTGGASCLFTKANQSFWVFSAPTEASGTITMWEDD